MTLNLLAPASLARRGVTIVGTGMRIDDPLEENDWAYLIKAMATGREQLLWAFVDALLLGKKHGWNGTAREPFKRVSELTGYSSTYCYDLCRVGEAFPFDHRYQATVSHHRELLSAPPSKRDALMRWAIDHHISATGLREKIAGEKSPSVLPAEAIAVPHVGRVRKKGRAKARLMVVVCPNCGQHITAKDHKLKSS